MKAHYLFIVLIGCLVVSCKRNSKPQYQQAIDDLARRYPELNCSGYMLSKSISNYNNDSVELKLELFTRAKNDEPIVILSNASGQTYALPFPNNDHRDYWCFYGDTTNKIGAINRITFSGEINNALKLMRMEKSWQAERVFKEIFTDLLECRPILTQDTIAIKKDITKLNIPDSCSKITINNYEDIFKNVGTLSWELEYNTFDDIKNLGNRRIYQFVNENPDTNGQPRYRIKVYRVPCIKPVVYL